MSRTTGRRQGRGQARASQKEWYRRVTRGRDFIQIPMPYGCAAGFGQRQVNGRRAQINSSSGEPIKKGRAEEIDQNGNMLESES
jgi:hypothetical protein